MLSSYSYVDKLSGRPFEFGASNEELMIQFDAGDISTLDDIFKSIPSLSLGKGSSQRLGIAALSLKQEMNMVDALESLVRKSLALGAIPVMVDGHGALRYFIPQEIVIQFRDDIDHETARQILVKNGSEVVTKQRTMGHYTVKVPESGDLFDALHLFSSLDEVIFAEPSEVRFLDTLHQAIPPTDPEFVNQWGLENSAHPVGQIDHINVLEAWPHTFGDPRVIIVVLDTGVDMEHIDIESNLFPRNGEDWSFTTGESPHVDSHGTHVAGIAVADNNDHGIVGVAPGCLLMPLQVYFKISDEEIIGKGQDVVDAINYVIDHAREHPHFRYVLNCSFGSYAESPSEREAIRKAVANNILVVAAAGNNVFNIDGFPCYPADYDGVLAVAALSRNNVLWQNPRVLGRPRKGSNFGKRIDVAAPGHDILSTVPGGYDRKNGTSMAAPFVSGTAALVWSVNPCLSNTGVREVIKDNCTNIDNFNPDFVGLLGRGRIDAGAAVSTARDRVNSPGCADILGFGSKGVFTSVSDGFSFQPVQHVLPEFGYDQNWRVGKNPRFAARIFSSVRQDIVGFGTHGVFVSRNDGQGNFSPAQLVLNNFGTNHNWEGAENPRYLADLNHNQLDDIVGFGTHGVFVSRNDGQGNFSPAQLVLNNFGTQQNWQASRHLRFLADVEMPSVASIVGFGNAGVFVSQNDGQGNFGSAQLVLKDFGYDQGWRVDRHIRLLTDMNNDGRADIVGFGYEGVFVSQNDGQGNFGSAQLVLKDFGYDQNWRGNEHPRFLVDLTGNGRSDIVGFGDSGVFISLNVTQEGGPIEFQTARKVLGDFGFNQGWGSEHPRFVIERQ